MNRDFSWIFSRGCCAVIGLVQHLLSKVAFVALAPRDQVLNMRVKGGWETKPTIDAEKVQVGCEFGYDLDDESKTTLKLSFAKFLGSSMQLASYLSHKLRYILPS